MGFEKGNKYGQGRPPKSKNIVTNAVRELFERILIEDNETIFSDLKELSAFQRLKIKIELAKYILPSLKSIDTIVEVSQGNEISQEDIKAIKEEFFEKY
jgi:adenylyl- and sulfurtransferase ThiI